MSHKATTRPESYVLVAQHGEPKKETKALPVNATETKTVARFSQKRKVNNSSKSRRNRSEAILPPSMDVTITYSKTYRFVAQDLSATQRVVTVGSLLLSLGSMAISTTQVSSICSSFKIRRVSIYPAAGGIALLEWVESSANSHTKDSRMTDLVPTGITIEKPMHFIPPKGSDASFWQSGAVSTPGSANLFALSTTVGSVVDVEVTCTIQNDGTNYQDTGYTGLTTGLVYYPALEGRATNDFLSGRPPECYVVTPFGERQSSLVRHTCPVWMYPRLSTVWDVSTSMC